MRHQLDDLNDQAMGLIKEYAGKNDPVTIAAIAATANRIRQLSDQFDAIQREIPQLKETLVRFARPQATGFANTPASIILASGRAKTPRSAIRVEVDWQRVGIGKEKETINEYMASDTLTKWVARLHQELGEKVLKTLCKVKVSRGPFVSNDPTSDYRNQSNGKLYQHQPVLNSGYFVLTHSNTSQKVGDIAKACRALGLPTGTVVVAEVEK